MMLFGLLLVVALAWFLLRSSGSSGFGRVFKASPEEIIRQRFAKGEINAQEMRRALDELKNS